jgi:hypothetical protein
MSFFIEITLINSRVIFQNQQDMDYFTDHNLVKVQAALIPSSEVDIDKFHPTPIQTDDPLLVLPRVCCG